MQCAAAPNEFSPPTPAACRARRRWSSNLLAAKNGAADHAAFDAAVDEAVADVIAKQTGRRHRHRQRRRAGPHRLHRACHRPAERLRGPVGCAARHRRAGVSRAGATAQAVRLAVPASSGMLGAGVVEGFRRRRSRHRARQGGDDQGRRRRGVHDLAVARPDRALSEEQLLQDRRRISVHARRRDEARVSRHRRCGLHPAARLPRSGDVLRALSRHRHRRLSQDHRDSTSRRSTTRSRICRPTACACMCAGARRSARTTATCR